MKLLTASQMKNAELLADCEGLSQAILKENAASAAAELICHRVEPCKVVVVCGNGNNGGDGFICASALVAGGFSCTVILARGNPGSVAAQLAFNKIEDHLEIVDYNEDEDGVTELICAANVLVDAVFGIGFHGDTDAPTARLLGIMNSSHALKFSLDIPSGCRADDGSADKNAFSADITIGFGAYKPAHFISPAAKKCGEILLTDIGIKQEIFEQYGVIELADEDFIKERFPVREKYSNKGDFGRTLILAGQPGMCGAAKLAAKGASKAGSGLVELFTDKRIGGIVAADLAVQMTNFYATDAKETIGYGRIDERSTQSIYEQAKRATAIVAGCGWGSGSDRADLIFGLADRADIPMVLDADALNSIVEYRELLGQYGNRLILTPHPGEFSRLTGIALSDLLEKKLEAAINFAVQNEVTLLLKGADTIITDGERVCVVTEGSPAMAKGGSGDLLAGVIGGFAAQGIEPFDAACLGAWCCGKAGQLAAEKYSITAADATNTLEMLSQVFLELEK